MASEIILGIIVLILYSKIVVSFYNLKVTYDGLNEKTAFESNGEIVKILILIPALREQNVIVSTLEHFKGIEVKNIELIICVAGTSREKNFRSNKATTVDIVRNWIESDVSSQTHTFRYVEIDEEQGDRATQLNYAVKKIGEDFHPDIIGVYDADSLPDIQTLNEVVARWVNNKETVFQQPVHFIDAANRMAISKKNPILVANALYQTTWTVIREYSTWRQHHLFCKKNSNALYYRNDYLIGHGEFIPYAIYSRYYFPEQQITDGIQLGYRLSMSGVDICPLNTFCVDDVPQSLNQLIGQHKRWFGGCNLLLSSYRWCKENMRRASLLQVLDGFWSQISWAYAGVTSILGIILAVIVTQEGNFLLPILEIVGLLVYCYIIPYISISILPTSVKVRFLDWVFLPVAIFVKGIGPNLYIFQTILSIFTQKKIKYSKVER